MSIHRRLLLVLSLNLALACGGGDDHTVPLPEFHPVRSDIPVAGPEAPGVQRFDEAMKDFLVRWNVPGASIAVARDGELVLARSYGWADYEAGRAVVPGSRFRVASISKVLTALAVLKLAEEGALELDAPFLEALPDLSVPPGGDRRLEAITIRQLLRHAGGWDRGISPDYTQWQERIASDLGIPSPAGPRDIAAWVLGRRLDFDPGARFAYSNVGYLLLGRVIEAASGQTYERYVRDHVLEPMGVHAMTLGAGPEAGLAEDEVRYYDTLLFDSAFPGEGEVPSPYAWSVESMDSYGGWIASAADLTRVLTALDGSRTEPFLAPASVAAMTADPGLPDPAGRKAWPLPGMRGSWHYGLGLFVRNGVAGEYWHGGSLLGSQTSLGRLATGEVYALLVNTREERSLDRFAAELVELLPGAIAAGSFGATDDLYPSIPSPELPPHTP